MASIDKALADAVGWVTYNKTLKEHFDYAKYRRRMDSPYPPVIEKAFTLLHEEGYKFVETPGKEDTIVSHTTEDDDVARADARNLQREQHERLHELLHVPTDGGDVSRLVASSSDADAFASGVGEGCEFGTLSDAAASTIKKLKTMPRSSDYLGNDYAHVRFLVATDVRGMNIHTTTDPQQKAKLKKTLYESLLAQDGALNFCPGYGKQKRAPEELCGSVQLRHEWNQARR